MKKMTCKQLGGACDMEFTAATFDEIADKSRAHGIEMYKIQDSSHLRAMDEMKQKMKDPDAMNKWMEAKRAEFDGLDEV